MYTDFSNLSNSQLDFLTIFYAFTEPISIDLAVSIAPLTSGELLGLIDKATSAGWIGKSGENRFALTSKIPPPLRSTLKKRKTEKLVKTILGKITKFEHCDEISAEMLGSLAKRSEEPKLIGYTAHEIAINKINKGNLKQAIYLLLLSANFLESISGDSDCDQLYVSLSLNISDIGNILRMHQHDTKQILKKAKTIAKRHGDKRNFALVNMHLGRLYHRENRLAKSFKAFKAGMLIIEKLGDDDIISQAAEFIGLYYYIQGKSNKAAKYFEKALSHQNEAEGIIISHSVVAYLGNSAAFLGQFYRGIGVLDAYWQRATLKKDYTSGRFIRSILGTILLMAGKMGEAITHIRAAQKEALEHKDAWALVLAQRALSYYHFLNGRPFNAHKLLKNCLIQASKMGLIRPFYAHPWVLELLFEFHQMGFDPIPGYNYEQEQEAAINGINIHIRGTAYRHKARQAFLMDENDDVIENYLYLSEADLRLSHDPVELAKTRVEIARLRMQQNKRNEAQKLAFQAWESLSIYGFRLFPDELKPLISGKGDLNQNRDGAEEILRRFIVMIEELIPSADEDDYLLKLVTSTCRLFEAERGGIFLFKPDEKPSLNSFRVGYNLTRDALTEKSFQHCLPHVVKAGKENESVMIQLNKNDAASASPGATLLCIPFSITNEFRGILYYDNSYIQKSFQWLNRPILDQIANSMGNYVRRIWDYCQQVENRSLLAYIKIAKVDKTLRRKIITQCEVFKKLIATTDRSAITDATVLIQGESGVGKELLARRIHLMSQRSKKPFVAINIANIQESLVGSELFGHEKGAFTGADSQKPGLIELAHKGTLFIDEIGDAPMSIQTKLLRVIQEKSFTRVGGVKNLVSDFRLVTATNRDLLKEIEVGHFREDLYYRLNVVPFRMPPLREREGDTVHLADHFLAIYAEKHRRPRYLLTPQDKSDLRSYYWPGNIRELKNIIERFVILSSGEALGLYIPLEKRLSSVSFDFLKSAFSKRLTMDELQRQYIKYVIKKTNGKISGPDGASDVLGMKRTTLYGRMKKLEISERNK